MGTYFKFNQAGKETEQSFPADVLRAYVVEQDDIFPYARNIARVGEDGLTQGIPRSNLPSNYVLCSR